MIASEIHFGVEFETTLPASDNTYIGSYHHGAPVPYLPAGWKAERDSSIQTIEGRRGCEFVSPKLLGATGLQEIRTVLGIINARGAKVNPSCGMHVTVTWTGESKALARLLCLMGNYEKGCYASTGTKRRESGHYCKPVKQYNDPAHTKARCESDRFHAINLSHLARGANRIEFRLFAGSLNADKVIGHILMCLALVEIATTSKRPVNWDYKCKGGTPAWARAGVGQTELTRLFYRLGWIKGHTNRAVAGDLVTDVELKAIKKKLVEMAKKYDRA